MELALVLLIVLIGTGAIVYAGLRPPAAKPESASDETAPVEAVEDGGPGEPG